eukprot:scaffold6326_cov34-Tisochrysis_lutea.AAC.3
MRRSDPNTRGGGDWAEKTTLVDPEAQIFILGPGEDFPSSLPARIRIRSRAMATDPPGRPTFAAL